MGAKVIHGALDYAELAAAGLQPDRVLDFSSNLNPFGPPKAVHTALAELDPAPYPDRSCLQFRDLLAALHGCDRDQILPGNGSNELIHLIARSLVLPGEKVLMVGPTFGEYEQACRLSGGQIGEWRASPDHDFRVDSDALIATIAHERPRLVWLCSPNNPTGIELSRQVIDQLTAICAEMQTTLVIDRTYASFVHNHEADTLSYPLAKHVLQLYSLTKSYALAGLRIGYLIGDPAVLQTIARFQPTWSVSSAAQAAGCAALRDSSFLASSLVQLWQASDALQTDLTHIGLRVWRASLPFLLVETGDGSASRAALLQRGFLVRDCSSFGLPSWVRIAPRQPAANAHLVQTWKEIL